MGMGGVGSVAAEMLTRCGIGRLLMYGALPCSTSSQGRSTSVTQYSSPIHAALPNANGWNA